MNDELMCRKSVHNLVSQCIPRTAGIVHVIIDNTTRDIAEFFISELEDSGIRVIVSEIETARFHGIEPDGVTAQHMLESDVIMCITKYSLAHTKARFDAQMRGIPFLSMPGYNEVLLSNDSMMVDYVAIEPSVRRYSELLTQSKTIRIRTEKGSDITLSVDERFGNCCPGIVNTDYFLGSPPDIEANISPIENLTEGVLIIDGSITDERIGVLKEPVELLIRDGRIRGIKSTDSNTEDILINIFDSVGNEKAYYVGEFGIGFNDKAKLCGNMLIDEGAKGCVHFGMGSNWTIGGKNKVPFHLDFVMTKATVYFDDKIVLRNGELLYG